FFKEKESGNVIAVRKASGETKRRIIISGHTDSAPEWTYTYKLGSHGALMVLAPAIAGLTYTAATAAVALSGKKTAAKKMAIGQAAFLPAYGALYKFTNSKRYVDGANDDLTGCYVASSVLKYLSDNDIRFENTEVIAMLAGGEEAGLRGSKAFFKDHPEYKNDGVETVFISADTIRDEEYMMIYEKDMTGMVKNDKRVCDLLKRAGDRNGKDIPIGAIPLGSTDAAAASQAGIAAASIVAMDPAPARYYHTRLDTADILNPDCIEKVIGITLDAVFDFDENGLEG
ncbi:MAG: M28 family peptidase, partial [Clostridia bacterium]|nr:M28 family peptidase [Clostridia bacterium]